MKKWLIVSLLVVLLAGAAVYAGRGSISDSLAAMGAPRLPAPTAFKQNELPAGDMAAGQPASIEGGVATSQHYVLLSSPQTTGEKKVDPLAVRGTLPDELNMDVPFTIQAPDQNWNLPYEEACEEASIFMVADYYSGKTGLIPVDRAKSTILKLVDYEIGTLGDYKHTTAVQTGKMAMDFFKLPDARVIPIQNVQDIKRLLANGFPVIVPAAGQLLGNPNFKAPGPIYHMFVIKGYTKSGLFITDEPGTRRGHNYTYSFDTVMNAMHDYDADDMQKGKKVVLVLLPSQKP